MATLQEHVEEDDGSSVWKYYRTDSDDPRKMTQEVLVQVIVLILKCT